MSFTWGRRSGWLCLIRRPNLRTTSCYPEYTFLGSTSTRTSAFRTTQSRLPSGPYWRWSLCCRFVCQQLLRVLVLLNSCHHPKISHKLQRGRGMHHSFLRRRPFPMRRHRLEESRRVTWFISSFYHPFVYWLIKIIILLINSLNLILIPSKYRFS